MGHAKVADSKQKFLERLLRHYAGDLSLMPLEKWIRNVKIVEPMSERMALEAISKL
jgi:hypothetical protein